jgi:hypothetical protein
MKRPGARDSWFCHRERWGAEPNQPSGANLRTGGYRQNPTMRELFPKAARQSRSGGQGWPGLTSRGKVVLSTGYDDDRMKCTLLL